MITVITPFQRKENLPLLIKTFEGKVNWTVLIDDISLKDIFPSWVTVKVFDKPPQNITKSNWLFNEFIAQGLEKETQYMILCDDDSVEEGFFDKIPNDDIVIVSMKRSDREIKHVVWTDWSKQMGYWEESVDILKACPENMRIAGVGGEQLIIKGKVLKNSWDVIRMQF